MSVKKIHNKTEFKYIHESDLLTGEDEEFYGKIFKNDPTEKENYYLRRLRHGDDGKYFTNDLIEMIPCILKQQGNLIREDDERLQKYREEWAPKHEDIVCTTVSEAELMQVMEEFDVDKSLITIFPDFEYALKHLDNRIEDLFFLDRDGNKLVFRQHAINEVFKECIVGVNWIRESSCEKHPECVKTAKDTILNMLWVYMQLDENSMISLEAVKEHIDFLKSSCHIDRRPKNKDYLLQKLHFKENCPITFLVETAKEFDIFNSELKKQIPKSVDSSYPIWIVRALLMSGWIWSFFQDDHPQLKKLVFQQVCHLAPDFWGALGMTKDSTKSHVLLQKVAFAPSLEVTKKTVSSESSAENSNEFSSLFERFERGFERGSLFGHDILSESSVGNSRIDKLAADREKRNQKLLERKRLKAKGAEKSVIAHNKLSTSAGPVEPDEKKQLLNGSQNEPFSTNAEQKDPKKENKNKKQIAANSIPITQKVDSTSSSFGDFSEKELGLENNPEINDVKNSTKDDKRSSIPIPKVQEETDNLKSQTSHQENQDEKGITTLYECSLIPKLLPNCLKPFNTTSCQTDPIDPVTVNQCTSCSKNIKLRSEAQEEAKSARNKLSKYEYDARQAQKRSQELKSKEMEINGLKAACQQRDSEIEIMKKELEAGKEREEAVKKIVMDKNDLIKREQQKNIDAQQKIGFLTQRIDGLQLKFTLQQSKIDKVVSTVSPNSSEPSTSDRATPSNRDYLLKWQRIKDDFHRDKMLDEYQEMIEKIISVASDSRIRMFAEYELAMFQGNRNIYLQTIEMNIAKIKKTQDPSNLLALPIYPKLSEKFVELFQETMNNQPQPEEPGLSTDTNCYMCYEPFLEGQRQAVCEKCENPVHYECEERWKIAQKTLNVKEESCAYCRQKMEEEENNLKKKKAQK